MTFIKNLFNNRKFLLGLLGVSLALNMFVIGTLGYIGVTYGGHLRAMHKDTGWVDRRIERVESRVLRFLDNEQDKQLARKAFATRRPAVRAAFTEMRNARRDLRAALRDGADDPAQMTAAINRSQAAVATVNNNFHGLLTDLAEGLSDEARAKLSKRVQHRDDASEAADY